MKIDGNKVVDRAANKAIDILKITTARLPYTDYFIDIRNTRNSKGQRNWIRMLVNFITPNLILKSGKAPIKAVVNMM